MKQLWLHSGHHFVTCNQLKRERDEVLSFSKATPFYSNLKITISILKYVLCFCTVKNTKISIMKIVRDFSSIYFNQNQACARFSFSLMTRHVQYFILPNWVVYNDTPILTWMICPKVNDTNGQFVIPLNEFEWFLLTCIGIWRNNRQIPITSWSIITPSLGSYTNNSRSSEFLMNSELAR